MLILVGSAEQYMSEMLTQYLNAYFPMLVTASGMVTDVRPLQLWNAPFPMLVTPSGIVMEVSSLQPPNAQFPMLVTLLGIIVFLQPAIRALYAVLMIALQLSLESYTVFPSSTVIEVRDAKRNDPFASFLPENM